MDIHISKLLAKMEKEIHRAMHGSNDAEVRERLLAVKTLCDLVLEEQTEERYETKQQPSHHQVDALQLQKMMGTSNLGKKKEEDGVNGDSIFDF
ncbi:YwdI family protein [Metabacillus idriensis]|uniref:YwdI family protein n=1 Tax=Metabacillus idriensis TaxID=324768 RepID=UPI003D276022